VAAALAELLIRLTTSGFYGALTAHLRRVEPAWHGIGAASGGIRAVYDSLLTVANDEGRLVRLIVPSDRAGVETTIP
jgi:hypothetical protein